MKTGIEEQLEFIRDFQSKYPDSHVGGSFGLFLQGVDLKRDLRISDIDITMPDELTEPLNEKESDIVERSDPSEFDYAYVKNLPNGYFKIDIRISPEPSYHQVIHDGYCYNVSKQKDILFWKKKFANKGVEKHIRDLAIINGEEYIEKTVVYDPENDLPF